MIYSNILTEKYVGDSDPRFKKIDKTLEKIVESINANYTSIRADLKGDKMIVPQITMHELNQSKENLELQRLYKDIFGLKEFNLRWDVNGTPNAMTPCRTLTLFDKETRVNGIHKNSKLSISAIMNTALITNTEMTAREVNAIILHEIGHNFYNSVFQLLSRIPINLVTGADFVSIALAIPSTLFTILQSDVFNIGKGMVKLFDLLARFLHKYPKFDKYANKTFLVVEELVELFKFTTKATWLFSGIFLRPIQLVKGAAFNMLSFRYIFLYNVEKHADSFAVDYGYGPELASALNKLRTPKNSITGALRDYKAVEFLHDISDIQLEIFSGVVSGYPSEQNRIKTGLDRLKRAQNDPNLTPDTRKALAEDIKMYEDFYYNHYLSLDKAKEGAILTWTYRLIIDKLFNGKMDIRELVHAIDPKKYN